MKLAGVNVTAEGVLIATAIPVAAYLGFQTLRAARKLVAGAEDASDSLGSWIDRRAKDENIFYAAANAVTEIVTLEPGTSLGSKVYDLFHPEPEL